MVIRQNKAKQKDFTASTPSQFQIPRLQMAPWWTSSKTWSLRMSWHHTHEKQHVTLEKKACTCDEPEKWRTMLIERSSQSVQAVIVTVLAFTVCFHWLKAFTQYTRPVAMVFLVNQVQNQSWCGFTHHSCAFHRCHAFLCITLVTCFELYKHVHYAIFCRTWLSRSLFTILSLNLLSLFACLFFYKKSRITSLIMVLKCTPFLQLQPSVHMSQRPCSILGRTHAKKLTIRTRPGYGDVGLAHTRFWNKMHDWSLWCVKHKLANKNYFQRYVTQ